MPRWEKDMGNDISIERRARYATAAADEGRVADLQIIASAAAADATRLLAAGEIYLASGALTVMLRAMLLRAATPAGSEGVAAEVDIGIKRRSAEALERAGAPVAAAMVRAAAAADAAALAGSSGPSPREGKR